MYDVNSETYSVQVNQDLAVICWFQYCGIARELCIFAAGQYNQPNVQ